MKAAIAMMFASMLVAPALGFNVDVTAKSSLSFDAEGAKTTPVNKVITLIKDMLTEMEKEAAVDQEVYEKMGCWCATNTKEKSKTIADAEARISDLTTNIELNTATSTRLNSEIKNLQKEIAADQGALESSTTLRQKQLTEFTGEEKGLLGTISSLGSATTVLSGKKDGAFMQMPQARAAGVATLMRDAMDKHASLLAGVLTHSERKTVSAFIQAPAYAPQGGEIFGILNQMKETFESNLATSQKEEATNQKAHEDLKAAKEDQIASGLTQSDTKTQELADTDEKNAGDKEDLIDTTKTLAADKKFMEMLKDKCASSESDYAQRTKDRHLEVEACNKALAVLTSDDAKDMFSKSLGFVQTESSMHSDRRLQASKLLSKLAIKLNNPRLAGLAVSARFDVLAGVKKAIDDMVAALDKEKAEEIKKKDFCIEEFDKNDVQTEIKTHAKADVNAKIADLEATIKNVADNINQLQADIAEMKKEVKYAGDDREKENKEFQMTVADQRATQKLLTAALNVLKGFYDKKAAAALVQDTQPASFSKHKKNAGAGGVMAMIQSIINDAKATEDEAIRSEQDSQKAYESLVKNTNASTDAKNRTIVNKAATKSKAEADLVEARDETKAALVKGLEQLAASKAELHASCDFVVKNFDLRQTTRDEEVDALKQAKAVLSGSKIEAFMQDA